MTTYTLADLQGAYSESDAKEEVLQLASSAGFPTDSWQERSLPRAILDVVAPMVYQTKEVQKALAKACYRSTASEAGPGYLDVLVEDFYGLTRRQATVCERTILVTNGSGTTLNVSEGSLTIRAIGSDLYFSAYSSHSIAAGSSATVTFKAAVAGSAHSATFSGYETVSGATSATYADVAITVEGFDEESDLALNLRADSIFGELSHAGSNLFYDTIARAYHPTITRVKVRRVTPSAGAVTIVIGGDLAPCASGIAAALEAVIDPKPDHGGLAPENIDVYVTDMTLHTVAVTGTFYVLKSEREAAESAFFEALTQYERSLDIGKPAMVRTLVKIGMGSMSENERNDFVLASPTANVTPSADAKIKFVPTISWVTT